MFDDEDYANAFKPSWDTSRPKKQKEDTEYKKNFKPWFEDDDYERM